MNKTRKIIIIAAALLISAAAIWFTATAFHVIFASDLTAYEINWQIDIPSGKEICHASSVGWFGDGISFSEVSVYKENGLIASLDEKADKDFIENFENNFFDLDCDINRLPDWKGDLHCKKLQRGDSSLYLAYDGEKQLLYILSSKI